MTDYSKVTVTGILIGITLKAYRVQQDTEFAWLPKSQVEEAYHSGNIGRELEFTIPEWLADKTNLEVD